MKCAESEEEEVTKGRETQMQLSCFINQDVKYLSTGLRGRLQEEITKRSATLNRDALYIKSSKVNRLPAYLTVQMVRFFYKEKESVNAKILKDVKFPLILDVFELCTASLQEKMMPVRVLFKEMEDRKVEQQQQQQAKGAVSKETDNKVKLEPYSFPDDVGSNNSGYYELSAVLTHQGRSSSSGHYVAWVRRKEDEWVKCDDDRVSVVHSEEILKLSGGGDWHIAYVLLYSPRRLEALTLSPQPQSLKRSMSSAPTWSAGRGHGLDSCRGVKGHVTPDTSDPRGASGWEENFAPVEVGGSGMETTCTYPGTRLAMTTMGSQGPLQSRDLKRGAKTPGAEGRIGSQLLLLLPRACVRVSALAHKQQQ
ncbi:unnamed protein product [Lampetra planeri]